jgi:hypothetical protein
MMTSSKYTVLAAASLLLAAPAPAAAGTFGEGTWLPPPGGVWLPACTGDAVYPQCDQSTTCSDAGDVSAADNQKVTSGLTTTSVCLGDVSDSTAALWTCPTAADGKWTAVLYPTVDCTGTSTGTAWGLKTAFDTYIKGECLHLDATSFFPWVEGTSVKVKPDGDISAQFPTCGAAGAAQPLRLHQSRAPGTDLTKMFGQTLTTASSAASARCSSTKWTRRTVDCVTTTARPSG